MFFLFYNINDINTICFRYVLLSWQVQKKNKQNEHKDNSYPVALLANSALPVGMRA